MDKAEEIINKYNWHIERLQIKDLKPHPKNPRQINKQQAHNLTKCIKKFGLIELPIVNTDHMIIGGHQRIRILKKMKVKITECWVPGEILTAKDVEELCIGLNLHQGSFDWDILANEWNVLDLLEYGFTDDQLTGCIQSEDEEKEEKKKKPKVCPSCGHEF